MEIAIPVGPDERTLEHIRPGMCFYAPNTSGNCDVILRCYNVPHDGLLLVGVRCIDGSLLFVTHAEYANNLYQSFHGKVTM